MNIFVQFGMWIAEGITGLLGQSDATGILTEVSEGLKGVNFDALFDFFKGLSEAAKGFAGFGEVISGIFTFVSSFFG